MDDVAGAGPSPRLSDRPRGLLDNYGTVLFLLVASFVMTPGTGHRFWRVAVALSVTAAVLVTYRASRVKPRTLSAATWLVALGLVLSLGAATSRDTFIDEWVLLPLGLLLLAGPWVILRRVFTHRTVTAQTILGAVCVYIYLGMIFAFIFGFIDAVTTEDFFAQGAVTAPGRFMYFSFVTLTTLGYGDLSPATSFGQNVAVLVALTGSIYLVTLVARLVGLYGNPNPTAEARRGSAPPEAQ